MIRYIIFTVFFTVCSLTAFAQSSQISDGGGVLMLLDLEKDDAKAFERGSYTGKTHELGDSITSLLDKVEYTYVYYVETGGAYSSKEKKIEKPEIYYSINKIVRHYDRMLRKDKIEVDKAREELFIILNNGIALKNYQTEVFEMQVESTRNKDELARLFKIVKFQ